MKEEGIGPDHSLVFDVPHDVIEQAKKQRFEPRPELFELKATG